MKRITLAEQKEIQLRMLQEIDAFCREHGIKYSLAFGTLLGAIRHHGYIPWDDDMDLLMPYPDMLRFKDLFHSETLEYVDADTDKKHPFSFSRITHVNTINKCGKVLTTYGVNIDLYPFISIPKDITEKKQFFEQAEKLDKKKERFQKWNDRIVRHLPVNNLPNYNNVVKRYRDFILKTIPYGSTGMYYIVAGPLNHQEQDSYDIDLFEKLIEVDFENQKFLATAHYDVYLTHSYGNYMQLPPEDKRHPYHGANYYWK